MSNCASCAHNRVCTALRVADVVQCEEYTPMCKGCRHYMPIYLSSKGECPYMLQWTGEDDFCSMGEAK